jgi:RHS repeat-associated protein
LSALRTAHAQGLGQRVYYHLDHLGSPQLITDAAGIVVEKLRYYVDGGLRAAFDVNGEETEDLTTSLTFGGHQPDTEAGLIYFGGRYYDPELGLFLTMDPAEQFASPYAYAGYDPVNATDPDGLLSVSAGAILAISALVAGGVAFGSVLAATNDPGTALFAGFTAAAGSYAIGSASGDVMRQLGQSGAITPDMAKSFGLANTGMSVWNNASSGDVVGVLATTFLTAVGMLREEGEAQELTPEQAPDGSSAPTAGNGSASFDGQVGATDRSDAFLVSRPTDFYDKARHNFVVTRARYLGDPEAAIHSFGMNRDGKVGAVDDSTLGTSQGTYAADVAFWKGLSGPAAGNPNLVRIPASSARVESFANALIENQDYSLAAGAFGANSNSAAQAIANRAAGFALPVPGGRWSVGARSWREIQFAIH